MVRFWLDVYKRQGFYYRKFIDETPGASTRGRNSEMWMPRFRMSEAYMIAAEASFELENGRAAEFINAVRNRCLLSTSRCV